jgi:hypothetical protein
MQMRDCDVRVNDEPEAHGSDMPTDDDSAIVTQPTLRACSILLSQDE